MEREPSGRPRGGSASSNAPRAAAQGRSRRPGGPSGSAPNGRPPRRRPRPSRRQLIIRWVVLLAVAGAVLIGVIVGLKALFNTIGEAISSAASAANTPAPTPTGPLRPVDCTPADVQITLTADAESYRVGRTATFDIAIAHTGTLPCTLDAGNVGRELVITSGEDRIFSSADCDSAGSKLLLLAPGDQYPGTVAWATNRSAPGCPADLPALMAGSYQAVVTAGTVSSPPIAFTIG
ncbi:hypothetical protein SAMN05216410_0274 [Sanguibacter gelidistatuariae]|uniref:Uncharacterized protein n=1 Tax=Sanguibacter gelidistatuariae TaxID=1814289 RepID=A0A1G6Y751_9MICO|nr:hypothetical protein [Sanguibacter gelidistatuariae]SDD85416.1 hypothetical protein SAMN05216410_0274 [Sanguibacter gelidistatuariae]